MNSKILIIIISVNLLLVSTIFAASFKLMSLTFRVYSDGATVVGMTANTDITQAKVTVPILGSQISEIIVLDQDKKPLTHNVTTSGLTVETFGASKISLNYTTPSLVKKNGDILTFNVTTPITSTVILPSGSTVLGTNQVPIEISQQSGKSTLMLPAGPQALTFKLGSTQPMNPPPDAKQEPNYVIFGGIFLLGLLIIVAFIFTRIR